MATTDRAKVLDLVLDAVDPRQDSATRVAAAGRAKEADAELAFTYVRGMTFGLLKFVREKHGDDALGAVIGQLTATSMKVLDHDH